MDSIISTFHIDWKIIIAQMVNFGVVFTVLYIFALKPLSKLMVERSEKISEGVDDAKANAKLLEESKAQYEKSVREAEVRANKIFQDGKKEAEAKKVEMMEAAKAEVATIIAQGNKVMEANKVKMVEDAKKDVVNLVTLGIEKLIKSKQDFKDL